MQAFTNLPQTFLGSLPGSEQPRVAPTPISVQRKPVPQPTPQTSSTSRRLQMVFLPDSVKTLTCYTKSKHRQRFLQPDLLQSFTNKARAETFGDKINNVFKDAMVQEVIEPLFTASGGCVEGFSDEKLQRAFTNTMKQAVEFCQNVPNKTALHWVLNKMPQRVRPPLEAIFESVRKEYWDSIEETIRPGIEEDEDDEGIDITHTDNEEDDEDYEDEDMED